MAGQFAPGPDPFDPIRGSAHPYFSPSAFVYYEARAEWYHWISRDYFTYSNDCWYSLQYAIGWDSNFANYHTVRGILNFDLRSWLSVGAEARAQWSSVYEYQAANAYVVLRWPCCK